MSHIVLILRTFNINWIYNLIQFYKLFYCHFDDDSQTNREIAIGVQIKIGCYFMKELKSWILVVTADSDSLSSIVHLKNLETIM